MTLMIQAGWRLARGAGRQGLHRGRLRLRVQDLRWLVWRDLGFLFLGFPSAAAIEAAAVVVMLLLSQWSQEFLQKLV